MWPVWEYMRNRSWWIAIGQVILDVRDVIRETSMPSVKLFHLTI